MADFQSAIADTGLSVIGFVGIAIIVVVVLAVLITLAVIFAKKRKWNLRLEIKLPRSDGKLILSDKAKGYWDREKGWIVVKRKGFKPVPTRPVDPKQWLKGTNFATLIQIGPEDFIIADERSYTVLKDSVTGQSCALMDIVADVGKRKVWKNYTERMSKKAFTLKDWLEEHKMAITIAIIVFVMFIGFSVLWARQGSLMRNLCGVSQGFLPLLMVRRVTA